MSKSLHSIVIVPLESDCSNLWVLEKLNKYFSDGQTLDPLSQWLIINKPAARRRNSNRPLPFRSKNPSQSLGCPRG